MYICVFEKTTITYENRNNDQLLMMTDIWDHRIFGHKMLIARIQI